MNPEKDISRAEFDTYLTVTIFHSPQLAKGINPENLQLKSEVAAETSIRMDVS